MKGKQVFIRLYSSYFLKNEILELLLCFTIHCYLYYCYLKNKIACLQQSCKVTDCFLLRSRVLIYCQNSLLLADCTLLFLELIRLCLPFFGEVNSTFFLRLALKILRISIHIFWFTSIFNQFVLV